jgi:hypothetical protein
MDSRQVGDERLITFSMDVKAFNLGLKEFVKVYDLSVENSIKRIGLELLRRTIGRTSRVDTGRMKNGWHVSFHVPSDWEPPTPPKGRKASSVSKPNPGMDRDVKTLFLQNNVHYAPFHEYGTNKLSPLYMLTVPIQEMTQEMTGYLLRRIEPLWNKTINGITATGLTAEAKVAKAEFMKRFSTNKGTTTRRKRRI